MPHIVHTFILCSLLFQGLADPAINRHEDEETVSVAEIHLPADLEVLVGDPTRVRDMRNRFDPVDGEWCSDNSDRVSIAKRGPNRYGEDPPLTRGGVGYGVCFESHSLLWTDITAVLQDMIVPRTPGGDVYTDLYLVTTNRSNCGTEAYISYHAQDDFNFVIWDWGRWFLHMDTTQTVIPYEYLGDYIHDACNPDGVFRQILRVINITERTDFNDWNNMVYLYNRKEGIWDLVYFYAYTTLYPNQNLYNTGDPYGSWGPTFETFQDHDGSNKPIGFDECWIYQDGELYMLTPDNSWIEIQDPDLDPPIFLVPNLSWAVGSTEGEPENQVFEAEAGSHEIGQPYPPPVPLPGKGLSPPEPGPRNFPLGFGWIATPADGEGWLLRGPSWTLPSGRMNAEFQLAIANADGSNDPICVIGVWDETTGNYAAVDTLNRHDFARSSHGEPFRYDFEAIADHPYEFVVYSLAEETFGVDRVIIVKN
jgi:hypothetical protein